MPLHLAISSPTGGRSFVPDATGRVLPLSGIAAVPRVTEAAPARSAADSAVARSIELRLGSRQEEALYDRRGQLDTPPSKLPAALARAAADAPGDAARQPGRVSGPGAAPGPDTDTAGPEAAAAGRTDPEAEAPEPPPALDVNAVLAALATTGMAYPRPAEGAAADGEPQPDPGARERPVLVPVAQGRPAADGDAAAEPGAAVAGARAGPQSATVAGGALPPTPGATAAPSVAPGEPGPAGAVADRSRVAAPRAADPARGGAAVAQPGQAVAPDAEAAPRIAQPRLPGAASPAAAADPPARAGAAAGASSPARGMSQAQVDGRADAEARASFAQANEETGQRVIGEQQNVQLMAMAERNRQLLAAAYVPEPALPSDPAKAADDVRPSDVDQPWR